MSALSEFESILQANLDELGPLGMKIYGILLSRWLGRR